MKLSHKPLYYDKSSHSLAQSPGLQRLTLWIFYLLVVIHCVENTSLIYLHLPWIDLMYKVRNLMYVLLLAKAGFAAVYRPKELWFMLAVLAAAALSVFYSTDFALMEFVILAIALKDLPHRKLLHAFAVIKSVAIFLTLLGTLLNLIPNIVYNNGNEGVYYTYGFCHRNVLGGNMAAVCLAWLYLRYNNLRKRDVLFWLAMTGLTYMLALSRTSLIIMVLSIFAITFCHFFGGRIVQDKRFRWIMLLSFAALFISCLAGTLFYERDNDTWLLIDKFFTKRLLFASQCLEEYGFSIFGQEIKFVSTLESQTQTIIRQEPITLEFLLSKIKHLVAFVQTSAQQIASGTISAEKAEITFSANASRLILDNAYMRVLIYNGIIPGILFIISYFMALNHTWMRKNVALVAGMMIMAVYGVSERFMLDAYYNFPLLLAFISMFHLPTEETRDSYRYPLVYVGEILMRLAKPFRKDSEQATENVE